MAEFVEQVAGFEGGISNMVPSTLISRHVETGPIAFGVPVKQGTGDKECVAGIADGDFVGITVSQGDKDEYAEGDEARIMTEGVIWVKAAATVAAGQDVYYDSGWKGGASPGDIALANARYDTSGNANDLVQIRLWGAGALEVPTVE